LEEENVFSALVGVFSNETCVSNLWSLIGIHSRVIAYASLLEKTPTKGKIPRIIALVGVISNETRASNLWSLTGI
jgi:hypothetical protein